MKSERNRMIVGNDAKLTLHFYMLFENRIRLLRFLLPIFSHPTCIPLSPLFSFLIHFDVLSQNILFNKV